MSAPFFLALCICSMSTVAVRQPRRQLLVANCGSGKYVSQNGWLWDSCSNCQSGRYQDRTGHTAQSCKICPAGKYQNNGGRTSCKSCSAGKFQGSGGSSACNACGAGQYQNQEGRNTCKSCPRGKFQDQTSKTGCETCGSGQFGGSTGQTSCTPCGTGQYQNQGSTDKCKSCPAGKYQDQSGKSNCKACGSGQFGGSSALTRCTACGTGRFQSNGAQASCEDCAAGQFQAKQGQTDCVDCSTGQYQNQKGQVRCKDCVAGSFQNQLGRPVCKLCAEGRFQISRRQSECSACTTGRFQNAKGSGIECHLCATGKFSDKTSARVCDACPIGRFQSSEGQSSCSGCSKGEHQDLTAQSGCKKCAEGHFQDVDAQASCKLCREGHYQDNVGQYICKQCSAGTYSNEPGSKECKECSRGRYLVGSAGTECKACPEGKTTKNKATTDPSDCQCSSATCCAPGKFLPSSGGISCIECPRGQFQASPGTESCDLCPSGRYQNEIGQTFCSDCGPGRFGNGTGGATTATSCLACPAGMFQDGVAQQSCRPCAAGTYQSAREQSSCTPCRSGSWSAAGSSTCAPCPVGRYGLESASQGTPAHCAECSAGQYQENTLSTSCIPCRAGKRGASGRGKTSEAEQCEACSAGYYQSSVGNTTCEGCDVSADLYQPTKGQVTCILTTACQPGQRVVAQPNSTNDRVCTACEKGSFSADVNALACTLCPFGWYQSAQSRVACIKATACQPGEHIIIESNATVDRKCSACVAGQFSENTNSQNCKKCPIGKFQDKEMRSFCNSCVEGQVCGEVALPQARACSAGHSCTASKETLCGIGQVSLAGKGRCETCPKGKFARRADLTRGCIDCPTTLSGLTCARDGIPTMDGDERGIFCQRCLGTAMKLEDLTGRHDFVTCRYPGVCNTTLHEETMTVFTRCAAGRQGALCDSCADGFGKMGPVCHPCPPNGVIQGLLALVFAAFVVVFAHCVRLALKHGAQAEKSKFVTMTSIKIILTFLFTTSLLSSYDLDWGTLMTTLFSVNAAVSSGDSTSVALTGCVGITIHAKMWLLLAAPLLAMLLPLPAIAWIKFVKKRHTIFGAHFRVAYRTAVVIAWWLLHPALLRECMLVLLTRRVGEETYVAADLSIRADDPDYAGTRVRAWLLMLTFVLGLPLHIFVGVLYRNRQHLRSEQAQQEMPKHLRQQYFYFYGSYKPSCFWWESVNFATKSAMVMIATRASIEAGDQGEIGVWLVLATWVVLLSFVLEFKYEAYRRPVEDKLVKIALGVQLWLFLLAQALVIIDDKMPDFTNTCKAVAGLIMLVAAIGTAFVFVQQCFAKVKEKQRAKTMRGDRTDNHSLSTARGSGTWRQRESDRAIFTGSGHVMRSEDFRTDDIRHNVALPLGETGFEKDAAMQHGHDILNPTVNPMRKEQDSVLSHAQEDLKTRAMRIYSAEDTSGVAPSIPALPNIEKRAALTGNKVTLSRMERRQKTDVHL